MERLFECDLSKLTDEEKKNIASWYIEKHTPVKINFNPNDLPDASLIK